MGLKGAALSPPWALGLLRLTLNTAAADVICDGATVSQHSPPPLLSSPALLSAVHLCPPSPLWAAPHWPHWAPASLPQPPGPSSSASSSRPGRVAWASTWLQQTRSSSTTRTGIHTMTSRSVALTPQPCQRAPLPPLVLWAFHPSPSDSVSGCHLPLGHPHGIPAPRGDLGGEWRLCPAPPASSLYKRGNAQRGQAMCPRTHSSLCG